ncbi:MAG: bifunctional 4-hydroxy-2-oxoglutarate aldolase/2-dehydro-3-deoxy-phosphogluconate aldolase [Clostridia bacterium]|nr:bifunctional 4-hydroxy-2-oxoglutarate aldolase/2-dehydro-3-deoxy-phosphogluconate aldolase [Clostridia bacterium]
MKKEVSSDYKKLTERLAEVKLVPVYTARPEADTAAVCRALADAGLPAIEITLRTPEAVEAIAAAVAARSAGLLGSGFIILAGTVLDASAAERALLAGADGIVSPGFDDGVVSLCIERGVPCFPGVATATELTRAVNAGLDTVKFFPAEASGGIKTIKALSGPFPGVRFMPTGGISLSNIKDYLALPQVVCCGGSFMFPKGGCEPSEISEKAGEAFRIISESGVR